MEFIKYGKKELVLKFTYNALTMMETAILRAGEGKFEMARIQLWAGLRHQDKELSIEDAGDMLDTMIEEGQDFEDIIKTLQRAIEESPVVKSGLKKAAVREAERKEKEEKENPGE